MDNWVPMHKPANTRCRHQFSGGCRVYHKVNEFPLCCAVWNCRWLTDPQTEKLNRPDRTHYVIDTYTDNIKVISNETGKQITVAALQVWVDPAFPDAWKDQALFDYAMSLDLPLLIRFNSVDAKIVMDRNHLPAEFKHLPMEFEACT